MIRRPWTKEEDDLLRDLRVIFGKQWSKMTRYIPGRAANQIEDRWTCHLSPSINKNPLEQEEKDFIMKRARHTRKWKKISDDLPGRTRLQVRNYYHSTRRRRGCTRTTHSIQDTLASLYH